MMDFSRFKLKPEPSVSMLFKFRGNAVAMVAELKELNILAEGSVEYNVINDMFEDILDRYVQCRYRDCRTCGGYACEESLSLDVPSSLLTATAEQRALATAPHNSSIMEATFYNEDRGIDMY